MNKTIEFLVKKNNDGKRVDVYLSEQVNHLTRSYIKKLIKNKNLKINKKTVDYPSTKIRKNDKVFISIIEKHRTKLIPKNLKLDIVYEDKDILIINKPKGMVVHPGAANYDNTLANALAFKYKKNLSDLGGLTRPGIVHRIDKDTSGLLVVAKNNLAHLKLGNQFNNHSIKRKYICLVWGVIRPLNGRIETLISRNQKNRQLMSVSQLKGKKAITNYKTIKTFSVKDIPRISLVECELETGRTHQIRVHLNYKGTSLLGDKQYGRSRTTFKKVNKKFFDILKKLKGQALHAQTLEFIHPTKEKYVKFFADYSPDLKKMLDFLNNQSG